MSKRKQHLFGVILSVLFILILSGWAGPVYSQDKYPTRPIELIVPYTPGGGTDIYARQAANYLKKMWGVPINVVNKPGGRGIPAILEVYQATPDGYTMLQDGSSSASMLAVATAESKDLPFEIMNRTFVAIHSANPFVFFVPSTSPFKTLKDFIGEAKKNPKEVSYTAGAPSVEFGLRQLFSAIGADISKAKSVMVKGASEAVILAAGGHITIGAAALPTTLPAIKAQTIRPLLITSKNRWPDVPDLPTSSELGYPQVNFMHWNGIAGPPKLPSHISNIWDKAIQDLLKDPGFLSQLKNTGAVPLYLNSKEMAERVRKETEEALKLSR